MLSYGTLTFSGIPTFLFKSQHQVYLNQPAHATSPFSATQHARDPIFNQWNKEGTEKERHELFLCDVCVGVPYPIQNWSEASYFKHYSLPKDYDSLMILERKTEDSRAVIAELVGGDSMVATLSAAVEERRHQQNQMPQQGEAFSEEGTVSKSGIGILPSARFQLGFKVFDATNVRGFEATVDIHAQIYPRFFAVVETVPRAVESFALPLCAYCSDQPATKYCMADEASLCEQCDEVHHSQNKIVKRHLRVPLSSGVRQCYTSLCHDETEPPNRAWDQPVRKASNRRLHLVLCLV
eukprot:Blabericola_migrator_1__4232@NODE_229_length_11083_cov_77_301198_g195_i0_p4_GENE_NODE_229_length_11083_cov_77_301198_g195_i0NODE_229_length_11083_cov_77_301198_g195_i0_p4_ORF_typecomplete_len295_score34_80zfB_box/PF00643_24/4_1e02zfB_box/PF00643_24/4e07zfB_box/PF00643_24/4e03CEBP_ZZ/PF16366_5/3_7e03CEBP_ZZ/PF16366_5/0_099DUF2318/PF10080_9/3_6e03DUF2318/PF10080_9/0_28_NODE_229_length_11083_cov_77_301198_g195_i082109094